MVTNFWYDVAMYRNQQTVFIAWATAFSIIQKWSPSIRCASRLFANDLNILNNHTKLIQVLHSIGILLELRQFLPNEIMLSICYSFTHSYLLYG